MTPTTFNAYGTPQVPLHPVRALLLAGSLPLFLGVLLCDIAYTQSNEIQWKNFASWLNAGALLLSGLALLWSAIGLMVVAHPKPRRSALCAALLLAAWVLGFVNSLIHAKDAGATLPEGLIFSVLVFALMAVASWLGLDSGRRGVAA